MDRKNNSLTAMLSIYYIDDKVIKIYRKDGVLMDIVIKVLSTLVAIEFLFIMYLETLATSSDRTSKTFNFTKKELSSDKIKLLMKNQGIYNGLIGLVILYAAFISDNGQELLIINMIYIVLVALYGAYSSSNISIFFKQGTLALITLLILVFS